MHERELITKESASNFSELLARRGFKDPVIEEGNWMTRLIYLNEGEIGIEIELDWREMDVYVIIVRLENGLLPDGYYVNKGRVCRKHLQNIIREQGWTSDDQHKTLARRKIPSKDIFMDLVSKARELLFENLDRVIARGPAIFD